MSHSQNLFEQLQILQPEWSVRASQLEMAEIIEQSIPATRYLMIEAPTGVGKTLAYLIGMLPVAMAHQKKLIIATATIGLQHQLMDKELPLLQQIVDQPFSFAIAKGRGRYFCPMLAEAHISGDVASSFKIEEGKLNYSGMNHQLSSLYHQWQSGDWSGDLDNYPSEIESTLRSKITISREACQYVQCKHYVGCSYYRARAKVDQAQVIVTNQDTLLLDAKFGGGVLLPKADQTFTVIDEAHNLPQKAVAVQTVTLSLKTLLDLVEYAEPVPATLAKLLPAKQRQIQTKKDLVETLWQHLHDRTLQLRQILIQNRGVQQAMKRSQPNMLLEPSTPIMQQLNEPLEQLLICGRHLLRTFSEWLDALQAQIEVSNNPTPLLNFSSICSKVIGELNEMVECCQLYQTPQSDNGPVAWWVNIALPNSGVQLGIAGTPIDITQFLQQKLWQPTAAVVLTSATLQSLKSFDYFCQQNGLTGEFSGQHYSLSSPFHYAEQATLHVPAFKYQPGSDDENYLLELASYLNQQLNPERATLVLFTNRSHMEMIFASMRPALQQRIIKQSGSTVQLIRRHQQQQGQHGGSVLFGLASLAEGIDLPGELCEQVIITRLPFPPMESPIEKVRKKWLDQQGKQWFMSYALPHAAIRLTQMCGRLLRRESDRGIITITDRRIIQRQYGHQMLNGLPDYRREVQHYSTPTQSLIEGAF